MSQSNIDFLFQVTGADRAFTVPRADGQRPPFGDHLSLASLNTAFESTSREQRDDDSLAAADRPSARNSADRNGSRTELSPGGTSATSTSTDDAPEDSDLSDESASPAESSATNDVETGPAVASQSSDTEDADDHSSHAAETAAGQAAVSNRPTSSAEGVAEAEAEIDSAAVDEATQVKANLNKKSDATDKTGAPDGAENGDAGANAAGPSDATGETSASAGGGDGEASGVKKSRGRHHSKNSTEGTTDENQKLSADVSGGSPIESTATFSGGEAQTEHALQEQLAGGEQQSPADESKNGQNDRANSRQRQDVTAVANKVVAAAVQGAAQANRDSRTGETANNEKRTTNHSVKGDPLTAAADRLHSQHAASKRGARTSGTDGTPNVDPARFVGRVAKAFQTAHERGGTLQLRLAPPELGALRLELTVKDGVMSASLETENQAAKRVLLEHLPALRERLAEQNIRVERFDVDVRREGSGQEPAPQNQERQQQNHSESRRQSTSPARTEDAPSQERPIVHAISNASGINLVA